MDISHWTSVWANYKNDGLCVLYTTLMSLHYISPRRSGNLKINSRLKKKKKKGVSKVNRKIQLNSFCILEFVKGDSAVGYKGKVPTPHLQFIRQG